MATFLQLIEDLAKEEVIVTRAEVQFLAARFGNLTYGMGTLNDDGSLTVPIDCIIDAVHEIGNRKLAEVLESGDKAFVERVSQAREKKVLALATAVQDAPTAEEAQEHWRRLEHLMFGI